MFEVDKINDINDIDDTTYYTYICCSNIADRDEIYNYLIIKKMSENIL